MYEWIYESTLHCPIFMYKKMYFLPWWFCTVFIISCKSKEKILIKRFIYDTAHDMNNLWYTFFLSSRLKFWGHYVFGLSSCVIAMSAIYYNYSHVFFFRLKQIFFQGGGGASWRGRRHKWLECSSGMRKVGRSKPGRDRF